MGHVANAIGWLTVAIAVAIVSLQVAYLLSADFIADPLPNEPLIDVTSAVILPTQPKGSVSSRRNPKEQQAATLCAAPSNVWALGRSAIETEDTAPPRPVTSEHERRSN